LSFVAGLVAVLYLIPFTNSFKSPGVLEATEYAFVVNSVPGYVEEILVDSGNRVSAGDPLIRLKNEELDFDYREIRASNAEILAMRQRALLESQADLKPIQSLLSAIQTRLERVSEDRESLIVRAPISGIWISPDAKDLIGVWLRRGTPLGQLIDDADFAFVSVVSQKDTSYLFANEILSSSVKLAGQAYETLPVVDYTVIPAEQVSLPSAALGFGAGGGVAIDFADQSGLSAAEPFYEVRLTVSSDSPVSFLHGRSGRVRFKLPDEPLLVQWYRKLRQLLQDRYQL
jgi:putative peptide zinc metalloprotease protein